MDRIDDADGARGSSYTIFVPLEDRPDETLLVHGYSGAYDRVSTEVADFLRGRESADGATVPAPTPETIARLKKRGYLTGRTPEQESAMVAALAARIHAKRINPTYVFM
ncbi:MAG: radical SAM/SPASM domain-containing protein, partial [Polyangia bacterium]